ncbi:SDR family NAD(P)-dependent oxidoreductase [Amycolatopsis sp. cmx-4-61]|uniref:SDR family NAD(P)-dependent oxidoreductase n=1 Tax=Amycolatopsis sp. cmx-4-61 TaxID=2790937 RepID=UPI0039787A02
MTTTSTDPRVALVTGGSGGIGRAVVERLARDGYHLGVHFSANKATADELTEHITAAGGQAVAVGGDVADEVAMAAAFDAVESAFGGIDVVVHTAGVMRLKPVVDQLAARKLRAGGAIVNFSTSVVGLQFPGYGAYVASKGAVEALTLVLARELRGRDITVNSVAPGPTATPLFLDGKDEAATAESSRREPCPSNRPPKSF